MDIEKQTWEENYRKKQENFLMQRERELKAGVKKDRNKEIELVIRQLEEDATSQQEDCERVAENRIKYVASCFSYDLLLTKHHRQERLITILLYICSVN